MDQTLSLGWTKGQAASRTKTYRRVLGINLVLYLVLAIVAIALPAVLATLVDLPASAPTGWVRAWGALLIVMCLLYLPAYLRPFDFRYGNVIGIPVRLLLAVVYLCAGPGFAWLAAFEAVFCVVLGLLYFSAAKAKLMSRP